MYDELVRKAATLPTRAGVYLFKDRRGRVIYVGKAINLRARVRQYLAGADERFMVPFLVRHAADVEVIAVDTEKEALLLENTLIKKHRPRYNTKLRDDSNFLHLRIDPKGEWPRWQLVRRFGDDKARYFGPYHSASRARQTLQVLQRHFPLRTCSDAVLRTRKRPCLLYQMKRCVAPCVDLVDRPAYDELLEESILFLEGRHRPLVQRLTERMTRAAEAEQFEEAARIRDLMRSIQATLERQKVVDPKLRDRDVWGLFREGSRGAIAMLPIREGMMGEAIVSPVGNLLGEDEEVLSSILNEAYPEGSDIPPEILVHALPSDAAALEEVLSERKGRKVGVRVPVRGQDPRLVELATENAKLRFTREHDEDDRRERALEDLASILQLPGPLHRIECFDNSNIQGQSPVAAMSVFIDGKPARAEYRRYRVKTVVGADDFATMKEILGRRVKRAQEEGTLPDLLVVDGGRGQVNAAMAALKELGMTQVPLIGISKPRTEHARGEMDATDKIVLPHVKDPIKLKNGHPALRILQHLRDEVHRHAVGYHRQVRGKEQLTSLLEAIPGVGPARRKALLKTLGSIQAIVEADEPTLAGVPSIGPALAKAIFDALHPADVAEPVQDHPPEDDEAEELDI
jgi:excinuclease ABC subunit C